MKSQNNLYVSLIVSMVVAIALLGFLVYVILGGILGGSAEILSEKKEVMTMQLQDKAVDQFKKSYEAYKPDLQKVGNVFIDSADPINFIKFLEGVATEAKVSSDVGIVSSSKSEAPQSQKIIAFQIDLVGDFSNIVSFFERLEAGPYLVTITNVTMNKIDKDPASKKVFQGGLEAHFLVEAVPRQ